MQNNQSTNSIQNNCFATSTTADLIDEYEQKRIGSAQFWKKGHLLQHGEILLDPPAKLWMEIFKTKSPKPAYRDIPRTGLDKILHQASQSYWPELNWHPGEFTKEDLYQVSSNANRYSLDIY